MLKVKEVADQIMKSVIEYVRSVSERLELKIEEVRTSSSAFGDSISNQATELSTYKTIVDSKFSSIEDQISSISNRIDDAENSIRESLTIDIAKEISSIRSSVKSMLDSVDLKMKELNDIKVKDGKDGEAGNDGQPGRDALTIDVLPGIDVERSYPARTYASHKGGVWISRRQTKGMDGWECIINGSSDITIDQVDERTYSVSVEMSDGTSHSKSVSIPAMIYKGVYKKESEYVSGDSVTWDGSVWVAEKDITGRPGESDTGWRLAVKKGESYRVNKDGIKSSKVNFNG